MMLKSLRQNSMTQNLEMIEMDEYIEREVALMKLMQNGCNAKNLQSILEIPTADVGPVVRWIPVSERLPKPETEVMIVCNRNGRRFIATAIHEDGTMLTNDSNWGWVDICEYGLYDEEHDDYIIPEGWWESRHFIPDDVYNCAVDCEVTHWMPMPELPKEENNG